MYLLHPGGLPADLSSHWKENEAAPTFPPLHGKCQIIPHLQEILKVFLEDTTSPFGTRGEIRTLDPLRATDFKSVMYTTPTPWLT